MTHLLRHLDIGDAARANLSLEFNRGQNDETQK
jgi:hypothetical protein